MSDDEKTTKTAGRRTFLVGVLTGAGAVAAVSAAPRPGASKEPAQAPSVSSEPVLYHRTEDVARYYRTLYR